MSYKSLDVEQIGYVYEGLLEWTVERVNEVTLELNANKGIHKNTITLNESRSSEDIYELLKKRTGKSDNQIESLFQKNLDENDKQKLSVSCKGDISLCEELKDYYHLLKLDNWGFPKVYQIGSYKLTTGQDRRETGTHYTPKSLTESIVETTLEPVAYVGPAEGNPREKWQLKSSAELLELKICDPAMGSGAFLVQVCRWLSNGWSKRGARKRFKENP